MPEIASPNSNTTDDGTSAKAGNCARHHSPNRRSTAWLTTTGTPLPPFACADPAPSVSPRAWGFLLWNAGGDCGLGGSLSPRTTAAKAAAARKVCATAPQSGHNKVSSLYVAGRRGMPRVDNKVSSFYGTQGGLAMLAAMRRTSSQIPPVLSSFPSLFRLQRWTELNHSSAGGRRGSGALPCMG
jgi:hypothetical protein